MNDTISRLAVIQIIEKMRARIGHNLERAVGGTMIEILDEVGEDVGKLPSAQPEIIRCCECKYLQCNMRPDGYLPKGVDEFECRHWCGSCDPMDFCSRAERRTE